MPDNELAFIVKMQDQASATLKSMGGSFNELSSILKQQMAAMEQLTAVVKSGLTVHVASASAVKEHSDALKGMTESLGHVVEGHKNAAVAAEKHRGVIHELISKTKEAAEAFGAMWASSELNEKTVGEFAKIEVGLIRMRQAIGGSAEDFKELGENIDKIASRSLDQTVNQLNQVAIAAHQLGGSKEQIIDFTTTISQLSTVTGAPLSEVEAGISAITAATGEGIESTKGLAEAISVLGNETIGGSNSLLQITEKLAHFTIGMHLSSLQIVGMASAMQNLNLSSRSANLALGQTLVEFNKLATDDSLSVQLSSLAGALGMNDEAFKALQKSDPMALFLKMSQAVKDLSDNGKDVNGFLSRFNLGGQTMIEVFTAAAANIDKFKDSIDKAGKASKGDQLKKDADDLAGSLVGLFHRIDEAVVKLGADLGKSFAPFLKVILEGTASALEEVAAAFEKLPEIVQEVLSSLLILTPAIFAGAIAFKFLKDVILLGGGTLRSMGGLLGGLVKILQGFVGAQAEVAMGAAKATTALEGMGVAATGASGGGAALAAQVELQGAIKATELAAIEGGAALGAMNKSGALKAVEGGAAATVAEEAVGFVGMSALATVAAMAGTAAVVAATALIISKVLDKVDPTHDLGGRLTKAPYSFADEASLGAGTTDPEPIMTPRGQKGRGHPSYRDYETHAQGTSPIPSSIVGSDASMAEAHSRLKDLNEWATKLSAIELQLKSVKTLEGATDDQLKNLGVTREQIVAQEELLKLQKLELDPINQQTIAWNQAMEAASAYTKAEQDNADTAQKVFEATQKAIHAGQDKNAAAALTQSQQVDLKNRTRDTSAKHEMESMLRTLATSYQLNQADKDRLEVDNEIVQLWETHNYTASQLSDMRSILELTKKVQEQTAQFANLNPQAKALQDYGDQLKILQERFPQGGAEFNREKTKLDQSTLAQRSPLGALAQQQGDEIKQLEIVGRYREADIKSLQEITQLEREGVIGEDAKGRAIAAQITENNRRIQDIKEISAMLTGLTESFGQGLSGAIQGAIAGQKYAFQKFLASFGGKLMDEGFKAVFKQFEPSVNGLIGGLFGQAKAGIGTLSGLAADQAKDTAGTAASTVAAMNIQANNVTLMANSIGGVPQGVAGGAGTGLPPIPGTLGPTGDNRGLSGLPSPFGAVPATATTPEIPAMKPYDPNQFPTKGFGEMTFGPGTALSTGLGSAFKKLGDSLGTPVHTSAASAPSAPSAALDLTGASAGMNPATLSYLQSHLANQGINVKNLDPTFAEHLSTNMQAAEQAGFHPRIDSGYRSSATQSKLYDDYINGRNGQGLAAPPGHSLHEYGRAADVSDPGVSGYGASAARELQYRQIMMQGGVGDVGKRWKEDPNHFQDMRGYPNQAANENNPLTRQATNLTDVQTKMTEHLAETTKQFQGNFNNLGTSISQTGSTALGAVPAMGSFGSSIEKMVSQLASGGGGGGFSGLGSILSGGGGGGASLFTDVAAVHGGGRIGIDSPSMFRTVNPAIFAAARRFHSGLSGDEFPAILQRGERVLTASQDSRNSNAMARLANAVANQSSPAGTAKPVVPAVNNHISMVVNTPDAPSFRRSSSQVMAITHASMGRSAAKNH